MKFISYQFQVTTEINAGNWESGNFSSVTKPVIREILEDIEISLRRFYIFKRIIISKLASTLDFDKGLFRGKEANQSADYFMLWFKEATFVKYKGLYDKIRDILINDNSRDVYDWYEVGTVTYDTKKRGSFRTDPEMPLEVTAHKKGVDRTG